MPGGKACAANQVYYSLSNVVSNSTCCRGTQRHDAADGLQPDRPGRAVRHPGLGAVAESHAPRRRRWRWPGCCAQPGVMAIPKASNPHRLRHNWAAAALRWTTPTWRSSTACSRRHGASSRWPPVEHGVSPTEAHENDPIATTASGARGSRCAGPCPRRRRTRHRQGGGRQRHARPGLGRLDHARGHRRLLRPRRGDRAARRWRLPHPHGPGCAGGHEGRRRHALHGAAAEEDALLRLECAAAPARGACAAHLRRRALRRAGRPADTGHAAPHRLGRRRAVGPGLRLFRPRLGQRAGQPEEALRQRSVRLDRVAEAAEGLARAAAAGAAASAPKCRAVTPPAACRRLAWVRGAGSATSSPRGWRPPRPATRPPGS